MAQGGQPSAAYSVRVFQDESAFGLETVSVNYIPDDAESCCGSSPRCQDDEFTSAADWEVCVPNQLEDCSSVHVQTSCSTRHQQHQCAGKLGSTGRPVTEHDSSSMRDERTQLMGDDFEALDAAMLLDEDNSGPEFPGGVDAALADWVAAVSSQSHATCAGTSPEVASHGQWVQGHMKAATVNDLPQQQQQQQQLPLQHLQTCWPPGTCFKAAAVPMPAQLHHPFQPAYFPQVTQLPCCQFAAFEGDKVGEVLAGTLPAPSCNSCDDWLSPLALGSP